MITNIENELTENSALISPVFSISTTIFPPPDNASKFVAYVSIIRPLPLHLILVTNSHKQFIYLHIVYKEYTRSIDSECNKCVVKIIM